MSTVRNAVFLALESDTTSVTRRIFDLVLVVLIGANITAVMLQTVPEYDERYHSLFRHFEIFSVAVFTLEYLARLWCIVDHGGKYREPVSGRIRFAISPMALIDFLAIAPFYLGLFINLDLRMLRTLRLLRIFKLTRYSNAMGALAEVIREEIGIISAAIVLLMVMMILSAGGIYLFEHRAQPDDFSSMPAALWWAVATLTTVGYGDVTPITVPGRFFGGLVMVLGIVMVALPAGILASALSEHLRARRENFEVFVDRALADGKITEDERHRLEATRAELGLSPTQARRILSRLAREPGRLAPRHCPHCGKSLHESVENSGPP